MAQAVVVTNGEILVEGRAAVPVAVDNSLPAVGPVRNVIVVTSGPMAGGPPLTVADVTGQGLPGIGPALPVYVVSGSLTSNLAYTNKVKALSPIAYWPLAESGGTTITDESGNSRNGTYAAVTLGATGIGDGRTSATFDGATSVGNVFSASFQGAFGSAEGTVSAWCKVSAAGIWTDAAAHRVMRFAVDATNFVTIQKTSANNQLQWQYQAGGTANTRTKATTAPTDWIHVAITWSKAADEVKAYYNGVQEGATMNTLGVWVGSLAATTTCIGTSATAPAAVWSGTLAHVAVWASPLSGAQIATLAVVP